MGTTLSEMDNCAVGRSASRRRRREEGRTPMCTSTAPSRSKIISDIRDFFARYGSAFAGLANGKRSDLGVLLEFYSAPLRFIGSTFHKVMKDHDAITREEG